MNQTGKNIGKENFVIFVLSVGKRNIIRFIWFIW